MYVCMYNGTLRRVRATTVSSRKSISITNSECVFVALGVQHEMRTHYAVTCGLPFPHYLINGATLGKRY
jgi:hypothetical protein